MNDLKASLSTLVAAQAEESDFSGVVSIVEKDDVWFEKAFGYADRSNRIPNQLDTRFGIASGTKFLTALAIGRLIDQGAVALESRLCDLVKTDFPNLSDAVTVRHLLTHTSGVYDYYDEEVEQDFDNYFVDIPWYQLETPSDYIPLFQSEGMKFEPGERYSYSNGGYILLGIIIEDVSGRRYRDFVAEEILGTCGMRDSGYFALNRLPERTALGYINEEDGRWHTNVYHLPIVGASDGGAFTTVDDVKKLWRAFFSNQILSPELTETFARAHVPAYSEGHWAGCGLHMRQGAQGLVHYIVGGDAGVGFTSQYVEPQDLIITVISNVSEGEWAMNKAITNHLKQEQVM